MSTNKKTKQEKSKSIQSMSKTKIVLAKDYKPLKILKKQLTLRHELFYA